MILGSIDGSTFVPGPLAVKMCTAIYLVVIWQYLILLAAADLVMILRVYAMWNQSKRILYILLVIYVPQVIFSFVLVGINGNPNTYLSVTAVQVTIDVAFCNHISSEPRDASLKLMWGITAVRMVLGVMLLILAVISTLKESVVMYKATKQWQPSCYMQLFMKDGILYFLANLIYNITSSITWLQSAFAPLVNNTSLLILMTLSYVTLCPIMPRFIISVRELYDHDRWQGVDTGFGVLSQRISTGNEAVSAIQFADLARGDRGGVDDSEAIRLETRMLGDGTRQV